MTTLTEPPVETAPTTTLKSQVALKLREAILSGEYGPGDRLNEARLAHEFNISRIPIREALIQLQEAGLVMNHERRGMCVTKLGEEDIQRINSARLVMETEAVWLARANMTPGVAARLENIVERMENMVNPLFESAALDLEFHRTIWDASGNPYLAKALDTLLTQLFAHKALENRIFARSAPPHVKEQMRVWRVGHHNELLSVLLGRTDTDPQDAILNHLRSGFEAPDRFSSLELRSKKQAGSA